MSIRKVSKNTLPEVERQVEIACKRISQRAVLYLEKVIDMALKGDPSIEPKVAIMAAKEVIDRGFGKPKQSMDQNININGNDSLIEAINQAKMRVVEKLPEVAIEKTELKH